MKIYCEAHKPNHLKVALRNLKWRILARPMVQKRVNQLSDVQATLKNLIPYLKNSRSDTRTVHTGR